MPELPGGGKSSAAPCSYTPAHSSRGSSGENMQIIMGTMLPLSPDDLRRYARHVIMPEVGAEGQRRLKSSSALVVGVGGLGSPVALYLVAAGVGRIGLVDFDAVDETNLHRQIMHFSTDVGKPKLQSAKEKLRAMNPLIEIETHETRLTSQNALDILSGYDVILDGTDNFPTRYLVNDACVLLKKPNVYASIFRFEGQVSVFWAERGPCYRCLFPEPPPPGEVPSCAEAGVLGVLPGIVGCLQANEAIKLMLGIGEPLVGSLLVLDALATTFRKLTLDKDPSCPVCSERPTITQLIDYDQFCGMKMEAIVDETPEVTVQDLDRKLKNGEAFVLLDVREPGELEVSRLDPCIHIPMSEVADRLGELNPTDEILVLCRSGNRSGTITRMLIQAGYPRAKNVAGGINEYARAIDPKMRLY
jgi:molybdopterin/thiamine biosynthesis adenylyltransferase/rhodanese-related sulfurtransferase